MQIFTCSACEQPVYFENTICFNCESSLGFNPKAMEMVALNEEGKSKRLDKMGRGYKFCKNHQFHVCNWLLPDNDKDEFCAACQLNRIIPNLSNPEYHARWAKLEEAKHRLVYAMFKLDLPIISKRENREDGLSFEFKSDSENPKGQRVLTGHASGVITLNIAEADDVEREMARHQMDEVYRTLLGHFRHEVAHYYWEVLIAKYPDRLERCRAVFGDDRIDYSEALQQHYAKPANDDWKESFISKYAAAHAWEDWAESWAHYMHIVDTLETANAFGVSIRPRAAEGDSMEAKVSFNAYNTKNFKWIYDQWLPVTNLMNNMNKSMGLKELYPFVINSTVYKKLEFVHQIIQENKEETLLRPK